MWGSQVGDAWTATLASTIAQNRGVTKSLQMIGRLWSASLTRCARVRLRAIGELFSQRLSEDPAQRRFRHLAVRRDDDAIGSSRAVSREDYFDVIAAADGRRDADDLRRRIFLRCDVGGDPSDC